MSEKRYYIKREGNHFKLSPQSQEEPLETLRQFNQTLQNE